MFGRIGRNLKSQKAGAGIVEKVSYTAKLVRDEVIQTIDKAAGTAVAEQYTLATQLLAIFLLDYLIENVVKAEVSSIYYETDETDFHQFLYGVERQMKHNNLLANGGWAQATNLRRWIQDSRAKGATAIDQQTYERIFGEWFLNELGVQARDPLASQKVGSVLRRKAFELYFGSQSVAS
jgi:enolase